MQYLRLKDIQARIPVSRSTLYRWMESGFPRPQKLGTRVSVWSEAAIANWLAAQGATEADPGLTADTTGAAPVRGQR